MLMLLIRGFFVLLLGTSNETEYNICIWDMNPLSSDSSKSWTTWTLGVEAASPSEMLVTTYCIQRYHIPQDLNLH
jgi:hypothetical protein